MEVHHVAPPSVQYLDVGGAARSHPCCVPVGQLSRKLEREVVVYVFVDRLSWEQEIREVAVRMETPVVGAGQSRVRREAEGGVRKEGGSERVWAEGGRGTWAVRSRLVDIVERVGQWVESARDLGLGESLVVAVNVVMEKT